MDTWFYRIVKPLLDLLVLIIFHPKVVGRENIPKKGPVVLAGNHTEWADPPVLCSVVRGRQVHFLAKIELFSGPASIIAKGMGSIPVNRKIHDKGALSSAVEALKKDLCIGVFPESTINRTDDLTLPFKIGAVKMSHDANATLVPFVITGKYNFIGKRVRIEFLKPIEVTDDLDETNERLRKAIEEGIVKNGGKHGK